MPKKATAVDIDRWRRLAADGKNYAAIAKESGWDRRTVAKALEADIKSGEARSIRQELFKERLGQHWDMLIQGAVDGFASARVLGVREHRERMGIQRKSTQTEAGATISISANGEVTVRATARDDRTYSLLKQHLPRDPLWEAVAEWESAMAADLMARSALYDRIVQHLENKTKLPVVENINASNDLPRLGRASPELVYEQLFSDTLGLRSLMIPGERLSADMFRGDPDGHITCGSQTVAMNPEESEAVYETVVQALVGGASELANSPEGVLAVDTYQRTETAVKSVHLSLEDLRLLPYLPGVCSLCGRVEI